MSTISVQSIVLMLGGFQLFMAVTGVALNPRRATNIVLAIYMLIFAVYSVGVSGMASAMTVEESAPWTWVIALVGLQISIGLIYLTAHIFRPDWLKRVYVSLPLAVFSTAPIVFVLIDGVFHTHFMYTGLNPRLYSGGYIELSAFVDAPLGEFFRLTNLYLAQIVQIVFLVYLLRQPDTASRRSALWILLVLEGLGALSQLVLRPIVGAATAFLLIQLSLTAGIGLAVSQTGVLSTQNLTRLLHRLSYANRRVISIRFKVLTLVAFIIVVIVGAQAGMSIDSIAQQGIHNDQQRLAQNYNEYRAIVSNLESAAASLATSVADRPDVQARYKAKDRLGLLSLLTPLHATLESQYGITHLNVIDPDGTVFARVDEPDRFGDNVLYRRTIVQTIANKQATAGLEIAPSQLGVRGIAPILEGDQFIGLVEVGVDYDQHFIDSLKNRTGSDFRLWVSVDAATAANLRPAIDAPAAPLDSLFFYASNTRTNPIPAPRNDVFQRVLATARAETQQVDAYGESWTTLVVPLQAYPDRTIGTIEISLSRTAFLADFQRSLVTIIALAVGLGLFAFALMWISTTSSVLNPLRQLTAIADRQLHGDLNARTNLVTRDEFKQLGDTLDSLTAQLGESIGSLEQRVRDRTAQVQASAEVGRAAASILDTDELLRVVVDLISKRFDFYYAAIFTVDDTQRWAVLREATGSAGAALKAQGHRLEIGGRSMVSSAIKTMDPSIALEVSTETMHFANPLLPDTRSEIALPLVVGDRVLGALDVQSTQAGAFDETNAAVLQSMANQIAIALSNAEQFKQTEAALQRTQELFAASQDLSTANNADAILTSIVQHAAPEAGRAGLMILGPRNEQHELAYVDFVATWVHTDYEAVMQPIKVGARLSPQHMPVVNYVTPGRPLAVNNVDADDVPQPIRMLMHRYGTAALIGLPIVAGHDLLGILLIGYRQAHVFQPDEIQTLLTLSGQAGNVLQTQRSLTETQAAVQQLNLLNRRLTGEAWLAYAKPLGGELTIQDTAPSVVDESWATELKTPLVVRGETIGSLGLQDTQSDRVWSSSDRELLAAVANEVAAAIDNARLLEQTERRVQRERLLAEISRKMLAASDLTHIARVAGEELGRALRVSHLDVVIGADSPVPDPSENGLRDKEGTL